MRRIEKTACTVFTFIWLVSNSFLTRVNFILSPRHFILSLNSLLVVEINGVGIVHIVLQAQVLAWGFLRSRRKVWFGAQAKIIHLTSQWRHNDVKLFNYDVIMTSYGVIFACPPNQNPFIGLGNLHTKIHAFSSMCTILLLFITISLHYQYVQI